MITCDMPTSLNRFDNSNHRRNRLKQRSQLPRSRHSETQQTYQKIPGAQNTIELGHSQKNLIDFRLNTFLTKSQQAIDWFTRSKLELMGLVKEIHYQNPGFEGIPCPLIEDGIEERYSLWKSKVDTFYKTIYNDVKVSLDRLISVVPLTCLMKNYVNGFVTYQRIHQLNSEFMQWVEYSQKMHAQRHQINNFMEHVRKLRLEIERHLRISEIDEDTYNVIKEKVATVVTSEFKQINYPEAPPGYYDFNYHNYMYVSSHKVKLIELSQKLGYLV